MVRFKELGEQLGLTEEETWIVRRYLANEGLLSGATIVYIVITHQGVKELEELLAEAATATALLCGRCPRLAAVRETVRTVRDLLKSALASGDHVRTALR